MTKIQELKALDKTIKRAESITSVVTADARASYEYLQEERSQGDDELIELALSKYNIDVDKMHTAVEGLTALTDKRCKLTEGLAKEGE